MNVFFLSLLLAQSAPGTRELELSRLPRLPGKADVALWRAVAPDRLVYGRSLTPVFVRITDEGTRDILATAGFAVQLNRWQLVQLHASQLVWALSADGAELRSAPPHWPQLDLSLAEIGADRVHAGQEFASSRRGRGVLVGIIDTGVDLTHPAFFDAVGRSRVVAVWDQDAAEGPAPKRFGYGRMCGFTTILAGECPIGDPVGHGTHVAGIAAGAGAMPGVAPEATLAVVRSDRFTRLADAVLFLVDLAHELDMPIVINMSVGGHYGPHDGMTPIESYLSDLVGPGCVLVAAAGNDGAAQTHLGAGLAGTAHRVELAALPTSAPVETVVDLWSDPTTQLELALELWLGERVAVSMPLDATGSDLAEGVLEEGDQRLFGVTFGVDLDADHGLVHRTLVLDAEGGAALPTGARLALRLSGYGRVDAWMTASDYRFGAPRFGASRGENWLAGDSESSIVVPATSPAVITVGAYTVRTAWQSESEGPQCLAGVDVGSLASFSSRGPTLQPEYTGVKPDLVAPGSVIASARAAVMISGPTIVDTQRVVMQGTSMAAPHVTGTVALMLETNPELDPARVKDQLVRTAQSDGIGGGLPSDEWGHGKVDAAYAVATAENEAPSGCVNARGGAWAAILTAALLFFRRRAAR